jgi:E3 ubiquitin-protein ligase HUWE1
VTSTFIHNEPTSLAILQEQKLPQSFLKTISQYENPNGEVLGSAVHAFGALCLNGQGLQMFNDIKPLPHFFDLMTSHEILRNPAEIDNATILGNTMDELIRHHPSLRPDVFQCVTRMIKKVLEMGRDDIGKPSDNGHCLRLIKTEEDTDMEMESSGNNKKKSDEKVECLLVSFIDLVSRVKCIFKTTLLCMYTHSFIHSFI